jgi:hypothetical protein
VSFSVQKLPSLHAPNSLDTSATQTPLTHAPEAHVVSSTAQSPSVVQSIGGPAPAPPSPPPPPPPEPGPASGWPPASPGPPAPVPPFTPVAQPAAIAPADKLRTAASVH